MQRVPFMDACPKAAKAYSAALAAHRHENSIRKPHVKQPQLCEKHQDEQTQRQRAQREAFIEKYLDDFVINTDFFIEKPVYYEYYDAGMCANEFCVPTRFAGDSAVPECVPMRIPATYLAESFNRFALVYAVEEHCVASGAPCY